MSKTLLLADDSVTIQKVVGISFASEDVRLLTVDNGDDALLRAREARPDLVLADVVMPGKNGYEVCAALKADPALCHIPVILLTGTFEAFDEERAREVGAASHVAKPFEAQTLVDEVMRVLAAPPAPPAPPVAADPAPPATQPAASAAPRAAEPQLQAQAETSPEDSFDFFDEDLGELSSTGPVSADESTPPAPPAPTDLDADNAFVFGEEGASARPPVGTAKKKTPAEDRMPPAAPKRQLAGPSPLAAASSPPERTIAILPDAEPEPEPEPLFEPDVVSEPDPEPALGDVDLETAAPEPLSAPTPPSIPDADPSSGFEFAFDDAADGPLDSPGDLAQEATVDPDGASGYDISSSDLGHLVSGPTHPITAVETESAPAHDPLADTAPRSVEALSDLDPIEGEPLEDAEPLDDGDLDDAEPIADVAPPVRPAAAALGEISPQLREELHDTLEKIAWEAFGEVTEKIVRLAVERVEQIAWEVIPQMAETLVREEIRRMKGESED